MGSIVLVEREARPISDSDFTELTRQPSFARLLRSGIVSVSTTRQGGLKLVASHFVGGAELENGDKIEVLEKAPGTVSGLFSLLSNARYRLPGVSSTATADGAMFLHIAAQFLSLVEKYLSSGRERHYEQRPMITDRPRGRLDVQKTVQLAARGVAGRVAVRCWQLTADTQINRVLAYCLAEIEQMVLQRPEMNVLLARSRRLFLAFQDVSFMPLARLSPAGRANVLKKCLSSQRGGMREILECAYPLFAGGGLFGSKQSNFELPSIFVDMEYLFERACVQVLERVGESLPHHEDYQTTYLFREKVGKKVEPDIHLVLGGAAVAVGDVKYKTLEEDAVAIASDVYQLLAHSEAFHVSKAFLVFPGVAPTIRTVGTSHRGIEVSLLTVRPGNLLTDLTQAVQTLLKTNLGSSDTQ